LIMSAGPAPDAVKPDFQGAGTHWNQGFTAFQRAGHTRIVMLMMPVRPESDLPGTGCPAAAIG
jgi:hypothetical protein